MHTAATLIIVAFIFANVWSYLDWSDRRDDARRAAYHAMINLQAARRAIATYPAKIAALDASAARLTAANLLISADYDKGRADVLRGRLDRARATLAA